MNHMKNVIVVPWITSGSGWPGLWRFHQNAFSIASNPTTQVPITISVVPM